ncbi:hypothetical protein H4W32_002132 [Actinophytocola algeriensis]|uniref:Uncharacterized protein n=1 Tax=Actinophytocola algeriensis TaxID=1768010 RepID=A0A7W7QGB4_9PSEU|nr:hypothetical protein [Actinophytocola algeriensis]MBE1474090.1 hypothetical protein [Actinophytocola algeriensis]
MAREGRVPLPAADAPTVSGVDLDEIASQLVL